MHAMAAGPASPQPARTTLSLAPPSRSWRRPSAPTLRTLWRSLSRGRPTAAARCCVCVC